MALMAKRRLACVLAALAASGGILNPFPARAVEWAEEIRFTRVQGEAAILRDGAGIHTEKKEASPAAGTASGNAALTILQWEEDWGFAEAGYVRGFVKKSDLLEAEGGQANGCIVPAMEAMDNPAFSHTHTTSMEVAAEKEIALAGEDCLVNDRNDTWEGGRAGIVGILPEGAIAYVLADGEREMVYIESGKVRGFVSRSCLVRGEKAMEEARKAGEETFPVAEELVPCRENRALYYTVTSIADPVMELRRDLVEFAGRFVGCPYRYGGDSLTGGIDCSGFVHAIYQHFGYSVPRTSEELRHVGREMGEDLEEALPGDIVCYDGHVAIYIGEGQIVHASNSKPYPRGGIKISPGNYREILSIRRVIPP